MTAAFSKEQVEQLENILKSHFDDAVTKLSAHVDDRLCVITKEASTLKDDNRKLRLRIRALEKAMMINQSCTRTVMLKRTAVLPTDRNYVFGCHPHGIKATESFITGGSGFSKLFPGIEPHLMTRLKIGMYRHFLFLSSHEDSGFEFVSYDTNAMKWNLSQKGTGNAVIVAVGGVQEVLEARRNTAPVRLCLNNRTGFVKTAMMHGSDLVPVFLFGENDIFQRAAYPWESWLRKIQERTKKALGFNTPLVHGRELVKRRWDYVRHHPCITTVVGKPIPVEKVENPSEEQVRALHAQYVEALKELFETHKHEHPGYSERTLTIC